MFSARCGADVLAEVEAKEWRRSFPSGFTLPACQKR